MSNSAMTTAAATELQRGIPSPNQTSPMTIVVHGGAGDASVSDVGESERLLGVQKAALAGWRVLLDNGCAIDAVEAAVRVLEDLPIFNAGRGSCLTNEGTIEMDAFIMDGRNQGIGAVGAVSNIRNPIGLARAIMERTPHCMFVGSQAEELATNQLGFERIDSASLITPLARQRLKNVLEQTQQRRDPPSTPSTTSFAETVGAVAVDGSGNVAAATSTGGLVGKLRGRVGDTPLAGCGGWADNGSCAISTTGRGEAILRVCLAHRCALNYQLAGRDLKGAAKEALEYLHQRVGSRGGMIVVNPLGEIAIEFTTERMSWSYCREGDNTIHYGARHEDDYSESLDSCAID